MTTQSTSPPPPESAPQPTSGGGSQGFLGRLVSNKVVLGIGGVAVVAVIAIVVVVFATGIIGDPGRTAPADFILDSSSSVTIVDVAAILASPEVPSQLARFSSLGMPGINPDDPEDWKSLWRNKWTDDFPQISGAIGLDDITVAMLQTNANGKALGWVFTGEFFFADIRDSLEDAGSNSDTYRSFEIWDGEIALLEDNGAIVVGAFAQDLLKSLDTDRGFLDDSSALKQALDKSGAGLVINGAAGCNSSFFQTSLNGCDAMVEVVKSGDKATSLVTGAYIFSSESRAESGLDDIEDAVGEQSAYDADINRIETDGQLITYEIAIIGRFIGGGEGEGENPQDLTLEDAPFVIVQNVATILETEFPEGIPQQMLRFQVFDMPSGSEIDLEDADEWKEEWRDVFADNMPFWLDDAISLEEVTYVMSQGFGSGSGLVISGNFDFEGIRETLEDDKDGPGLKDGEYRGFEVWGDNEIALLEDRELIVYSRGFVQEFLKALHRGGGGFIDDKSGLKRALDKTDNVLVIYGDAGCGRGLFFPVSGISRCEGLVDAVEGGDVFESTVSGVYAFRNENSAESGRDDIEDAIEDKSNYDADAERVENSGEFVTYRAIIHQDYEYEPPPTATPALTPAPTEAPMEAPLGESQLDRMSDLEIAQAIVDCSVESGSEDAVSLVVQYGSRDAVARMIADIRPRDELIEGYYEEC